MGYLGHGTIRKNLGVECGEAIPPGSEIPDEMRTFFQESREMGSQRCPQVLLNDENECIRKTETGSSKTILM